MWHWLVLCDNLMAKEQQAHAETKAQMMKGGADDD
jgi:hypothetical protein